MRVGRSNEAPIRWIGCSLALTALLGGAEVAWADRSGVRPEVLQLPSGPGSIEGLGESFEPNPNTGTSSYRIPIALPPGVVGFVPEVALHYSSGAGNGLLGLGWSLGLPYVQRGTDRGLPRYDDDDTIVLRGMDGRGAEDLVELPDGSYRFRVEGAFVRGRRREDGSWEFRNRSGVRFRFGTSTTATVRDRQRVFAWYLTEQEDTHGNLIRYEYEREGTNSYLTRIVYNDFSPAARNEVVFEYESRPDVLTSYLSTFAVETGRRIARIEVRHGGELVRRYDLGYQMMAGLSRLTEVTLTGRDGRTKLPTLSFDYAEFSPDASRIQTLANAPARSFGDVAEIDDVDGDGLPDLLVMDPSIEGGRYVWYPNLDGASFGERRVMTSSPSVWLASENVQLADMDGDGAADVVARVSSTSDGFRYYPGGDPDSFGSPIVISPNPSFGFEDPDVRLIDLDHDRRTDWMRIDSTTGRVTVAFNLGDGQFTMPEERPRIDPQEIVAFSRGAVQLADMNGDGLLDVVAARSGSLRYWPSLGFGRFGAVVQLSGAPTLSTTELGAISVRDLDGDGLSDLVLVGVREVRYWRNLSGRTLLPAMSIGGTPEVRPTTVVRMADMNGNGTTDIVWIDPANASAPWRYLDVLSTGTPGLLTRIDNGLGRVTTIEYAGIGEMREWARDHGVPWTHRAAMGQMVTARVTVDDSLGSTTTTILRYADGYFDGGSREFRGFGRAYRYAMGDATQPTLVTDHVFDVGDLSEARKGLPLTVTRQSDTGSVFDRVDTFYEVRTVAMDRVGRPLEFAAAVREERSVYEGTNEPIVLRTEWDYDRFGNAVREAKYGRVDGSNVQVGNDEVVVVRTYASNEASWIVDRVASEETMTLEGRRVALTRTHYDGPAFEGLPLGEVTRGDVTRVVSWVEDAKTIAVERNERDAFGNLLVRLDGRGGRQEIDYDDASHTFAVAERRFVEDRRFLEWTASWDQGFGKLTEVVGPNGQLRSYAYDALGRLERVVEPGDSLELPTHRYEYHLSSPSSFIREERRERSGEEPVLVTITHVDGLGRARGTAERAPERQWAMSGLVRYNARGEVVFTEHPVFTGAADLRAADERRPGVSVEYDALGRVLVEREADGAERQTTYMPLAERHYDENDVDASSPHHDTPITWHYDGLDRLRRVIELVGKREVSTTYEYDVVGNLMRVVDAAGRVRRYEYDGRSRRRTIVDPNAGTYRLAYDDGDSLVRRTDPEGHEVEFEYDLVGRVQREWHSDARTKERTLASDYHYDTPAAEHDDLGNVAGHLAWVEDAAGRVYFGYDARGRETDRIRRWSDGVEDSTWTDYDAADRVTRRGYPDGTYLNHAYDERGLLRQVGPILQDLRWTAFGSLSSVTYGNGVQDAREYDDRLRLRRMRAKNRAGQALRDLTYELDAASRITALTDNRSSIAPALDLSASYRYDDLYRLVRAEDRVAATEWTHDDVGNILTVRSGHAAPYLNVTNHYGENGAGPDQLTHFGSEELFYDRAGRMVKDGERTITWDAKGRISRVEKGEVVEEYVYGFDDRRAFKRTRNRGGEHVVRYIDRDAEERDGRLVRYVYLGDTRVVRLDPTPDLRAALLAPEPSTSPRSMWWLLFLATSLLMGLRLRSGRWRIPPRVAPELALMLFVLSCGKGGRDARDEARPIEEWPTHAELYLTALDNTPVLLASADGTVAQQHIHHPYGSLRTNAGNWRDPWGFVGNERDEEVGLADFNHRPYRAEMGRFLAVDPRPVFEPEVGIAAPMRLQAYSYGAGDPVNLSDASGLDVLAIGGTGGAGFGFGANLGVGLFVEWGSHLESGIAFGVYMSANAEATTPHVAAGISATYMGPLLSYIGGDPTASTMEEFMGASTGLGGSVGPVAVGVSFADPRTVVAGDVRPRAVSVGVEASLPPFLQAYGQAGGTAAFRLFGRTNEQATRERTHEAVREATRTGRAARANGDGTISRRGTPNMSLGNADDRSMETTESASGGCGDIMSCQ